jgi:hypothetical protein
MPSIVDQDLDLTQPRLALLPLFEQMLPAHHVAAVLTRFLPATRRDRLLSAEVTVQLVIAMNIYARDALTLVVATLFLALGLGHGERLALPGKSAITQARQRLGIASVRALFHRVCVPLATPTTPGAFLESLRLMVIDQSTELVVDTPENAAVFGKHSSQYGPSAFPVLLVCYLMECGTHAFIDVLIRPGHANPVDLARRLVRSVTAEMLVLLDRGLTVWPVIWALSQRGTPLLGRVQADRLLVPVAGYPDGSYLARLYRDPPSRRTRPGPWVWVRVLVYTLDLPGWPHAGETSRLITTLLDAERYPAWTLIATYHERWEVEVAIDELDTHQRPVGRPLRSKTPQLVIQELYGLLLAHYLIRAEMVHAVALQETDPDRLSFTHAIGIMQVAIPLAQVLPVHERPALHARIAQTLHRYHLPPREQRSNPRVVRRKSSKFPKKTERHRGVSLRTPFLDAICPSPLGAALRPQVTSPLLLESAA